MMANFCNSANYLLISFFMFDENRIIKWGLFDKDEGRIYISDYLFDDTNNTKLYDNKLHYLNDSTWIQVLDSNENDCNVRLQILHLKNNL